MLMLKMPEDSRFFCENMENQQSINRKFYRRRVKQRQNSEKRREDSERPRGQDQRAPKNQNSFDRRRDTGRNQQLRQRIKNNPISKRRPSIERYDLQFHKRVVKKPFRDTSSDYHQYLERTRKGQDYTTIYRIVRIDNTEQSVMSEMTRSVATRISMNIEKANKSTTFMKRILEKQGEADGPDYEAFTELLKSELRTLSEPEREKLCNKLVQIIHESF